MQTPMMSPGLMMPVTMDGFQKGWDAGMQKRREEETRRALAALAMNPMDPQAQAAAAPFAPQAVMQVKQQQAALSREEHERWTKIIGNAAAQADTPEKWDRIVDYFVQNGHPDAAQLRGKFSPELRAALMAQGGVTSNAAQGPTSFQEFQRAQSDPAYAQFLDQRRGPLIANNGDGTFTIIPRPQVGGNQQLPRITGAEDYNALPAGAQYIDPQGNVRTKGGQSGGGSTGGFPGN